MKYLLVTLMTLFAFMLQPTGASATSPLLSIPINTIVSGSVGSSHELKSVSVDSEDIGLTCSVVATAKNQHSIHPGNNLIVSSGSSNVTLENVERESNGLTVASGQLTLGNNVVVTLILGQDKIFSGGMDVELSCEQPPVEIEVCRDGMVITINEDEKRNSDTNPPCPVPEIEVCRDGSVITIKEDEKLASDTSAPCRVQGTVTVKELPNTGTNIVSLMIGTGGLSSFAYSLAVRKRL